MKCLACGRKNQKALNIYEMKKINSHVIFIAALFILSLFFLNSILHKNTILNNIHYINDLTFVSYNTKEALKNNQLPLWTPYFYAGQPLVAIPENYMFDLNFLFIYLFRDIYLAMNLSLIFYFFLAGLGMYLLIGKIVNNKRAAFISAIIYMFNGFMHSFIMHGHLVILQGYALIPFIFFFVYRALKSKQWILYSMLAGIFFALQIFSGSIILFFYTALIILFYLAFNLISKNFIGVMIKSIFVGIIIAVLALSLVSIKLLPVLEFTKMSSRAINVSFIEFLGEPVKFKDITRILITDIGYAGISGAIGIIGMIFLIYSLLDYKKMIVIFSFTIIIFSLLFASGTFIADVMYKIPGFDKLRHVERALVLFVFAGSILAAYGYVLLSERLKKYPVYLKYKNLFFAGIVSLVLLELLFLQNFPSSAKIIEPKDIKLLAYVGNDNSTFRTINLALKDIIGAAGYNYYVQKGISEVKGGGGIWVNDYVVFVAIAQQSLNPKILSTLNVKYLVSDTEFESNNITFVDRFNQCKECAVWNAFGPYLYKNELFLPRYYVVPSSILVVGDNTLVKQLIYSLMLQSWEPKNSVFIEGTKINDYDMDFLNRFSAILLLKDSVDQDSIGKLREYASNGGIIVPDILNGQSSISNEDINNIFNKTSGNYKEIDIDEYSSNNVVLELNGEKGWLVASERFSYFPGWKASINKKSFGIVKANNAISAVYLEGDKGKLVFNYKPNSYSKGKLISILALIIVSVYFIFFIYIKKIKLGGQNKA